MHMCSTHFRVETGSHSYLAINYIDDHESPSLGHAQVIVIGDHQRCAASIKLDATFKSVGITSVAPPTEPH